MKFHTTLRIAGGLLVFKKTETNDQKGSAAF